MNDTVIRYGSGGKPYAGKVGPQSTDVEPTPVVEEPEEPKVVINFVEDDTPVTDEELIKKVTKKGGN